MTDRNVERASKLDTATLSDALDRHGLNGQCYKIKPRSSDFRMTGPFCPARRRIAGREPDGA